MSKLVALAIVHGDELKLKRDGQTPSKSDDEITGGSGRGGVPPLMATPVQGCGAAVLSGEKGTSMSGSGVGARVWLEGRRGRPVTG